MNAKLLFAEANTLLVHHYYIRSLERIFAKSSATRPYSNLEPITRRFYLSAYYLA